MKLTFKRLHPEAQIPQYAHEGDSGMDLRAIEDVVLLPGVPTLVRTGLAVELPEPREVFLKNDMGGREWLERIVLVYEAQVRPRSGLALKHGITVVNSPGTVDSTYRGEIGVILVWRGYKPNAAIMYNDNLSSGEWVQDVESWGNLQYKREGDRRKEWVYRIRKGDRIAQLVIAPVIRCTPVEGEISETERGAGGFGSTGKA